jgi:hypothetical protein
LLADAERRALDAARRIADTPSAAWSIAPRPVWEAVAEIIRGLEAHWPDAATRPPVANAAILAFRTLGPAAG